MAFNLPPATQPFAIQCIFMWIRSGSFIDGEWLKPFITNTVSSNFDQSTNT
jgi:hypothetical protein